ncbi:MAG: methyl-accepting chemotaxis protein [Methyloprofundus sp.]|nr:methyl-accepting chemotaxis protein [Methyloprofundus sp.]
MNKQSSLQTKVLFSIALVFLGIILFSTWYTAQNQKQMILDLATEKSKDIARTYFDGLNTMMLTATMHQSSVLKEKTLAHDGVLDIRSLRGEGVTQFFGAGSDEQKIIDQLDQRAISGEEIIVHANTSKGREVTVIEPIKASADFRGTNCLSCHPVSEGEVLGAIRVTYSLATLDAKIDNDLMITLGINAVLFLLGMGLIFTLMKKIVVQPLSAIRDTMTKVEKNSDLSLRLEVRGNDEIAQLSSTFNNMLEKFSASLTHVANANAQLSVATTKISEVAKQTTSAAVQQNKETAAVSSAIQALEQSVQDVYLGAKTAAEASVIADQAASNGAATTKNAIDGIFELVTEIERAAEVIKRLDERSNGVSSVLDVIKGIAEQTNLLALNAAIEAARAGEQGRGFAVVADEVRTLATRSHQATEEIERIVEQLQHEAKDAVSVMQSAKDSAEHRREQVKSADEGLVLIADRVTHIRELNKNMQQSADNQSSVAQRVSQNIQTISQLADRTTQDAEQTNIASSDLVRLAKELTDLVNQFKL